MYPYNRYQNGMNPYGQYQNAMNPYGQYQSNISQYGQPGPAPMQDSYQQLAGQPYTQAQMPRYNVAQGCSMAWIETEEDEKQYLLSPGSTVYLWCTKQPLVLIKSTDNSGKPTITRYKVEQVMDGDNPQANEPYATKKDIEELSATIAATFNDIINRHIGGDSHANANS